MPTSTMSMTPHTDGPSPSTIPCFSAAKVTVRSATSTPPLTVPVRPSSPLGMSTASTGTSMTTGGDQVPRKPIP